MSILERFMAYAADFEKTLVDDDWSRLGQYFGDDAVYRIESDVFGCELTGPSAIFAGMKKSLDGLDRKFTGRKIAITEGPDVEGDELRVGWTVTYQKDALPPFVFRGKSRARVHDDEIVLLVDSFDERVDDEMAAWTRVTGIRLDPSYV
jgi:hypothetical protein